MKYILEIADALFHKHAVLMVGAGFSKNADRIVLTDKKFLNWKELSDKFYELLYETDAGLGKEYTSSLRLAEEVEAMFGRPKLEEILKDAIPDLYYAPSEIYTDLMDLPWRDIFTTNYDTLLERAAEKVINYRYNIIRRQEDLVNSGDIPRIIKLHGSFPSYRPFIITEEDYRSYPVKYAAMVNTVQQALLENLFCVIGFSCEDPNFISWIGWIRDNLGRHNSQKIYMISISHILPAKKNLLFEKNIIVVDLEDLFPNTSVSERLKCFFQKIKSYINDKRKKNNWLDSNNLNSRPLALLHNLNKSYPGWIFLPYEMKEKANYFLEKLRIKELNKLSFSEQISYIYEYVNILNILGKPIFENTVDMFCDLLEQNDTDGINDELKSKVQVIYLHSLRTYRECANWDKYEKYRKKIVEKYLDYNNKQFLYCSDCWYDFFRFKSEDLKSKLEKWNLQSNDLYWPLIKANLYAMIGEINLADNILEKNLSLVRQQLLKSDKKEYLCSLEECMVSLINFIRQGNRNSEIKELETCINQENISWSNQNKMYCFELNNVNKDEYEKIKDNFDLSSTYSWSISCCKNSEYMLALEYLRFLEQTGHPFRLQNITNMRGLESVIKKLIPQYSYWCFIQILITQESKLIDYLFGRTQLATMSINEVDKVTKEYLRIFEVIIKNVNPENHFFQKSVYEQAAKIIIKIVSRLTYKCSVEMLDIILDITLELCLSSVKINFKGFDELFKGLLQAYTFQQQEDRLVKILDFPIEMERINNYRDPITYIRIPDEKYKLSIDVYNKTLFNIKNIISNKKAGKDAITRLKMLFYIIELNIEDKNYLCEILESNNSLENKYLLFFIDKEKYKENINFIYDETLKRMKSDTENLILSTNDENYIYLLYIIKEIDIKYINFENLFKIIGNLSEKIVEEINNNRYKFFGGYCTEEKIIQIFVIAIHLLYLNYQYNDNLSMKNKKIIIKYFKIVFNYYRNESGLNMIKYCLLNKKRVNLKIFKKNIWLCDEKTLEILSIFYCMLYENNYKTAKKKNIERYSKIIYQLAICRLASKNFKELLLVLNLINNLLKNDIKLSLETEILYDKLSKISTETVIKKSDSEKDSLIKLKCRKEACLIAKELYKMGERNKIIEEWKAITNNKDEFIEVRNIIFE